MLKKSTGTDQIIRSAAGCDCGTCMAVAIHQSSPPDPGVWQELPMWKFGAKLEATWPHCRRRFSICPST